MLSNKSTGFQGRHRRLARRLLPNAIATLTHRSPQTDQASLTLPVLYMKLVDNFYSAAKTSQDKTRPHSQDHNYITYSRPSRYENSTHRVVSSAHARVGVLDSARLALRD